MNEDTILAKANDLGIKCMERLDLINYIKKHSNADEDILESLAYDLAMQIYYYGGQFRSPAEDSFIVKRWLKTVLNNVLSECGFMFKALSKNRITTRKNNIISNSYFSVNDELKKIGYNVYQPFWRSGRFVDVSVDRKLVREFNGIRNSLAESDFIDIINEGFLKRIRKFRGHLMDFYTAYNIAALIVPYDLPFFEKLSISIFKEIKRPSFVFLHGLPARYSNFVDNRTDYRIVWGDKIREAYINAGVAGNRIFVSGHPHYKKFDVEELAFDLRDILVITKTMGGCQWSDRGNLILYLYSVQNVLKRMGVGSVRVRMHPCENPRWYFKFIDNGFFKLDNQCLADSLKRSTLVIGPTSTVFLESMYYGVNYTIYEPAVDDIDLMKWKLVPPFNGIDQRIPVAKNEDELMKLLADRGRIDISCFSDYIRTPFDITFIKQFIKDQ